MYYYGAEINLLGINMNQLFWLSMVTFMLIMDDHYDLLVFVDDLDGEWDDYYLLLIGSFPHSLRLAPIRRCVPEDGKNSSLQIWKRWMVFFHTCQYFLLLIRSWTFNLQLIQNFSWFPQLLNPTPISAISSAPRWAWTPGRCTNQFPNLII